jgi:hypothetical protein
LKFNFQKLAGIPSHSWFALGLFLEHIYPAGFSSAGLQVASELATEGAGDPHHGLDGEIIMSARQPGD